MAFEINTREIQYSTADGQTFIGYLATPITHTPLAGVLVAPEWWGRNEYTEQRARELAQHGYAALAIDMYGDKKSTTIASEANTWMMQTFQHPDTLINRATAALNALAQQPEVQSDQLAAIGFCYGGKVVLDLARSGAALKAVATFHAALTTQTPANEKTMQAEILVLHGELDSMVSLDDVEALKQEMLHAKVEHNVIVFDGAKHGFSNPQADERAKANGVDLAYNASVEQKSLRAMYQLLERRLG